MKIYAVMKTGWFDTGLEYDGWSDDKRFLFLSKDKAIEYCESITNDELINWVGGDCSPWYITEDHRWTTEELQELNENPKEENFYIYGRNLDLGDAPEDMTPCWTAGASLIVIEEEVIE